MFATAVSSSLVEVVIAAVAIVLVVGIFIWSHRGRSSLHHRLIALAARLGAEEPTAEPRGVEEALGHLERATDRATEAVAESSADAIRLRRALDTLPEAVIISDEHGELTFRNSRAIALMTSRHGDALAAQAVDELMTLTAPGSSQERTLELYGPPRRTLSVRTQSIDNGQRALGIIAAIEDVSDRRRLEEVRRDFVANVSHELKTPMGALGLLAETLLNETEPDVSKRLAERIHTEAFRVSRIIDDLLDLSRIESEESPPREPVLVSLILAEAAERIRSAAEQRRIKIEVEEPSPPLTVLGDRRQLTSAVYNLLENAVKFSYEGSGIEVTGRADNDWVLVDVADHGVGIPTRELDRIFERFYRVDHGRSRATGGTGLGLAIVRHVANNHHGSVLVESREGEGSMFTLKLPLDQRPEG